MKFLLGEKQQMTQIFTKEGRVVPVTVIKAGPMVVTQVKTAEKDGYAAVQVGFSEQKEARLTKALVGHFKKAGAKGFKIVREFRTDEASSFALGQAIDASIFSEGDAITVAGLTKGKGFQGVVKRHGFHGGRRSHGQKHSEREPGSIGGGGRAGGRVAKGMRMAGRMGGVRVTQPGLTIVAVDAKEGTIMVKGAVPGHRGTLLELVSA